MTTTRRSGSDSALWKLLKRTTLESRAKRTFEIGGRSGGEEKEPAKWKASDRRLHYRMEQDEKTRALSASRDMPADLHRRQEVETTADSRPAGRERMQRPSRSWKRAGVVVV
jgi:hypothetical protein